MYGTKCFGNQQHSLVFRCQDINNARYLKVISTLANAFCQTFEHFNN